MDGSIKKSLSLLDVFAISSGAMISSGIFVLPGIAFAKSGPAMILAYILAAVLIIPTMLAKAELSTAMPKAGGTYFFIDRSLGPLLGVFGGFANWFSLSFKSAFALVGFGSFAILINPDISPAEVKAVAVGICILFTITNIFSVKMTGNIQVALVIFLISIITLYVARGFVSTKPEYYTPFMPEGFLSVVSTAGLVFVSFGGLTKIASIAEEIENPGRNIPLGMMLSFFFVTLLYVLAVGVTIGVVPAEQLSGSTIPLSIGARQLTGNIGMIVLSIAAIAAFITTANAGILSASRTPLAMSRDRLMPKFFSSVHSRFHTPVSSILLTSIFMIIVIVFLNIENLVKTASTLMILLYIMNNVSVIMMRESRIQNYRPKFKLPLYPYLPVFAIVSYIVLLFNMGAVPLLISAAFFCSGLIVYFLYARKHISRTSALMHVIERISAREIRSPSLGEELREIVIKRDRIIEDRFDRLIRQCEILDIPGSPDMGTLIQKIAGILSRRSSIPEKTLVEAFREREKQSATVIRPGLAIPHIIVPGEKCFDIMPVRCREGVKYSAVDEPVHTLFVLIGSLDERSYHLRALMAIANLVQESDFEKRWMEARNTEELRDVILLSSRKRDA